MPLGNALSSVTSKITESRRFMMRFVNVGARSCGRAWKLRLLWDLAVVGEGRLAMREAFRQREVFGGQGAPRVGCKEF